jgi:hypothetical protein
VKNNKLQSKIVEIFKIIMMNQTKNNLLINLDFLKVVQGITLKEIMEEIQLNQATVLWNKVIKIQKI